MPIDLTREKKNANAGHAGSADRKTEGGERVGANRGSRAGHDIGLVGPMSNYASPPQLVEGVPYRDPDGMHAFAARWRSEHRGQ